MNLSRFSVPALFVALALLSSCRKDEPPVTPAPAPANTGGSELTFLPYANDEPMAFHPRFYTNTSGDSFSVTKFTYYISNIQLRRTDGYIHKLPNSYHLIRHVEGEQSFQLNGLQEGTFNQIAFLIGVDSARNVSGIQTGALDPAHNMFWDWNTGYIFFKLEGSHNTLSQPDVSEYAIHVGGFEGPNGCLQRCTLALDSPLVVKAHRVSKIRLKVSADEIFTAPRSIGFDYYYGNITEPWIFREVSENYRDMFTIQKVEN